MNKFSIPAFVEELTPDAANAKYSKAKLKIFYVGETVDKRLFTKEFSDKLLSSIAYTPVVGFYSIADEDFVGHNNVQNIYGIVPESASVGYEEDTEKGVTFAVTDIILYTGRPDEVGAIASKIVGKQHSLELDPNSVQFKINRDEAGNFKNIEFTEGELIGLSVLGDNDTPAFSGSEFFSATELPDFITEDNQNKYQALFNAMFNVEPTAEEVVTEIYRTLESQRIYGYVCEHKPEQYVVICSDYGVYSRYKMSRNTDGILELSFECNVRSRYLSDEEIEVLTNAKKGTIEDFINDGQAQGGVVVGTEADENINSSASVDGGVATATAIENEGDNDENDNDEFQTLRSNYERLEGVNVELQNQINNLTNSAVELNETCKKFLLESYGTILSTEVISLYENYEGSLEDFVTSLKTEVAKIKEVSNIEIFEISNIDNTPNTYSEFNEADVVQKYKNKNRGKN